MANPNVNKRAPAMPSSERRAAIIAAVTPLLSTHGERVTTKQIATAAGIAEGTVFRVFRDKEDLICSAVEASLDPAPFERDIDALDRDLAFEELLVQVTRLSQNRTARIWALMSNIGPETRERVSRPFAESPALVALFTRNRYQISIDPSAAARALRGLTLTLTHPHFSDTAMAPTEIVALFLRGVQASPTSSPTAPGASA